jgi:hypothetical protein
MPERQWLVEIGWITDVYKYNEAQICIPGDLKLKKAELSKYSSNLTIIIKKMRVLI